MQDFVLNFGDRIEHGLSKSDLNFVLQELDAFITNYDITKKETGLSTFVDDVTAEFKMFLIAKKVAGRSNETLYQYNYHIIPFLYHMSKPVGEITDSDILVYLYTLRKTRPNISDRSLENIRLILSSFFGWLHDNGYIIKNPVKVIPPIKYEQKEINPINDEEFERIRLSFTDVRDKAIFEVLYSTGCRVSELVNLRLKDVNLQTKEVSLYGKGKKYRTSFLNTRALVALKDYLAIRAKSEDDHLFIKKKAPYTGIRPSAVQVMLRKQKIHLHCDALHPHLLRHQFANAWVDKNLPVEELQQILGHSKISTTQIYFTSSKERAKLDHQRFIA